MFSKSKLFGRGRNLENRCETTLTTPRCSTGLEPPSVYATAPNTPQIAAAQSRQPKSWNAKKAAPLSERMKAKGFSEEAIHKIEEKRSERQRKKNSEKELPVTAFPEQKMDESAKKEAETQTEKRRKNRRKGSKKSARGNEEKTFADKGVYCNMDDGDSSSTNRQAMISSIMFLPYRLKDNMQVAGIQLGRSLLATDE